MFGTLTVEGRDTTEEYQLAQEATALGRAADNDLCLQHPTVSLHHARILYGPSGCSVMDLGSSNGTYVNGTELPVKTEHTLADGDVIGVGPFLLHFHAAEGSAVAPLPQFEPTIVLAPVQPSRLMVSTPKWTREFPLQGDVLTLGRDPNSDIPIDADVVSRNHARLERRDSGYEIVDLGSTNGLRFQGEAIERRLLVSGDTLRIGPTVFLEYRAAEEEAPSSAGPAAITQDIPVQDGVTIGRGASNNATLVHPQVSRAHARIVVRDGELVIEDMASTTGTFVNGQRVEQQPLREGDSIRIGPHRMVLKEGRLQVLDEEGNLRLDALHLQKIVAKGTSILQDISLSIHPKEFVAIVGASGSGKSTLLNALCGFRPASAGAVLLNGVDLYEHFDAYRSELGYVPQDDIIHRELSVYKALDYAAQLRMPSDTTSAERRERIREVLEELDLTSRADLPIQQLSGGQRKRVSIGVELLTRPSLFFLDEATSGLDPGTEAQMMKLLRRLADQGRTILLVTHATKNVMMCDKVVILAKGGYLAYFGPPEEALQYFGVSEFDEIYDQLEAARGPKEWADHFHGSQQYREHVRARLAERGNGHSATGDRRALQAPGESIRRTSAMRQFWILSRRYLELVWRDKKTAALLLLIAPFLGGMDLLIWKRNMFDPVDGKAEQAITMLFLVGLITILVGTITSVREIVKEDAIYRRERMVCLQVLPYVGSKVAVGLLFATYSAVILFGFKLAAVDFSHLATADIVRLFVPFLLGTFSGLMWGLLVSALAPSEDRAMLLVILVLVPQFVFSGGMVPVSDLGTAGQTLGLVTSTRWELGALATSAHIRSGPCEAPDLTDCLLPGLQGKPSAGERQALLKSLDDKYGDIFAVNVYFNWGMAMVLAGALLGVTFLLQKRKDIL
ncbi:MAG TPA: FHA domain-containing protein [Dehalococcoidia bacterium]|nr:FHA domain-containing protein [Dehalococcoidia bacterium]